MNLAQLFQLARTAEVTLAAILKQGVRGLSQLACLIGLAAIIVFERDVTDPHGLARLVGKSGAVIGNGDIAEP